MINIIEKEFEIDVKRFYFPFKFDAPCPKCLCIVHQDFNRDYISFPEVNKESDLDMYCDECDYEWVVKYKIGMSIEVKNDKTIL